MSKSESAGATAVLVAKRSFQDIDELEHLSSLQREIKLTQLSLQQLECDFISVDFGEANFTFAESSCPVQCIGAKANEYLDFACVLDAHQPGLFSHGYRLSVHTLSGFDAERETRIIVPANQRCFFSYVKRSVIDDCLEAMDRTDIKAAFWRENYVYAPAALPSVQAYLREFLAMVQQQPNFLRQPHTKRLVLEDFIPLLLSAIPSGDKHDLGISAPNRAQLVQQAEDYLLEHLDQPLTLKALCGALNTSQRPLFYGFQEIFGLSPMAYVKVQRLHGVHRALRAANPHHVAVLQVAQRFGFWSAGHFSRDYKTMFGERPRDTLKKSTAIL
jgi:AraC family ethanolamine operon transcriptional activator